MKRLQGRLERACLYYLQPGELQGRRGVVCDRQHQRGPEGRGLRPAGAVFCDGCGQDYGKFRGCKVFLENINR